MDEAMQLGRMSALYFLECFHTAGRVTGASRGMLLPGNKLYCLAERVNGLREICQSYYSAVF